MLGLIGLANRLYHLKTHFIGQVQTFDLGALWPNCATDSADAICTPQLCHLGFINLECLSNDCSWVVLPGTWYDWAV